MIRFRMEDILQGTGGTLISSAEGGRSFEGISTDSRTIGPGHVFIAIRGQSHDGHDYLRDAWKKGAGLAIVDRKAPARGSSLPPIPLVVVDDTVRALQALASYWRMRHPIPLVAVVGSVGKTTTKEMTASILSAGGPCLKNPGNLNNYIGLPLSLLDLEDHHRCAVLEMGANIPGEIAMLSGIAAPQAAVITRLGWAHLEGFGDPDSLVKEKGSVLDSLPASGWCALNTGDQYFDRLRSRTRCRLVTYGLDDGEVTASEIALGENTSFVLETPMGRERIHLKGFGGHFVENALAAVAVTLPLDISLEQVASGLDGWQPQEMRGGIISPKPGIFFIDDTYNANPLSVGTALENLALQRREGVTIAVLGEMKELGDYYREGHSLVGRRVAELGIDFLIAVGAASELMGKGAKESGMDPERIILCLEEDTAVEALSGLMTEGVWVLFKGSRAARIEKILEAVLPASLSA
ncbi:MAG: UDP-N-acetylmuramoyl-tripeptide--D-alanyl-D-alanine ligase [bacterium]|nr:MAG: UDP-N-acetylmuramoyl-tripeptide--D-alanyl-D-alanine ligase [bacterium]